MCLAASEWAAPLCCVSFPLSLALTFSLALSLSLPSSAAAGAGGGWRLYALCSVSCSPGHLWGPLQSYCSSSPCDGWGSRKILSLSLAEVISLQAEKWHMLHVLIEREWGRTGVLGLGSDEQLNKKGLHAESPLSPQHRCHGNRLNLVWLNLPLSALLSSGSHACTHTALLVRCWLPWLGKDGFLCWLIAGSAYHLDCCLFRRELWTDLHCGLKVRTSVLFWRFKFG